MNGHITYSNVQKFGVRIFFFYEMNTCIQQGCIKLIKSDNKDNVCKILKKKFNSFHKYIKQLNCF